MEKRSAEEMANDAKLVEATRAEIRAKNLQRVIDKKRRFKNTFFVLFVLSAAFTIVSVINNLMEKKRSEYMALQIRDQGLKESRLVEQIRTHNLWVKIDKKQKETKQVEADYKLKHAPNVVIVFQPDDYLAGVKHMKSFNKPYFTCPGFKFQYIDKEENAYKWQHGFVVTAELQKLLEDTGVRYQRKWVDYGVGCRPKELDEVMVKPFVNW